MPTSAHAALDRAAPRMPAPETAAAVGRIEVHARRGSRWQAAAADTRDRRDRPGRPPGAAGRASKRWPPGAGPGPQRAPRLEPATGSGRRRADRPARWSRSHRGLPRPATRSSRARAGPRRMARGRPCRAPQSPEQMTGANSGREVEGAFQAAPRPSGSGAGPHPGCAQPGGPPRSSSSLGRLGPDDPRIAGAYVEGSCGRARRALAAGGIVAPGLASADPGGARPRSWAAGRPRVAGGVVVWSAPSISRVAGSIAAAVDRKRRRPCGSPQLRRRSAAPVALKSIVEVTETLRTFVMQEVGEVKDAVAPCAPCEGGAGSRRAPPTVASLARSTTSWRGSCSAGCAP